MNIIGISGKAGSGKDYIGKSVMEPLGFKKWALAWPMKNEAVGPNRNWTWDLVHNQKPDHVRTWLQVRGTEEGWMKYDADYWLRIAHAWMTTMEKEWGVEDFYIPDVRFPHEVSYIQSVMGGKVIRIESNRTNRLTPEQRDHLSETALDEFLGFDGWVRNNVGDIAKDNVPQVLTSLGVYFPAVPARRGEPYWATLVESDRKLGL